MFLVCAPHSNQFVDGVVLNQLFPRKVRFIGAASNLKRFIVGPLIKMMDVMLPVNRSIDFAKDGEGKIIVEENIVTVYIYIYHIINLG